MRWATTFLVGLVDAVPENGAQLARDWCHRRHGLGADGLILATPGNHPVDLVMTLFNADGSRAEISGNGIRCLAQAELRRRGSGDQLTISTDGGLRTLTVVADVGDSMELAVSMGSVTPGPQLPELSALKRPGFAVLRAATGDVGNPHVVLEVDDLGAVDPALDGPAIEAIWKPDGINVHFVVGSGPDELTVVHWERGAGVTESCGSGATVAAVIAHDWGLVGEYVAVRMPGGQAHVQVADPAMLTGPAVYVASIDVAHG